MSVTITAAGIMRFVLVTLSMLSMTGCASGPLGSHGVDYIPAFDTAPPGGGRG